MNDINRVFTITDKDGKEVELVIKNPSLKEREEAESLRIRTWNRALSENAPFAEKLDKVLRDQNLWDDKKDEELKSLREELVEIFNQLDKGGIKLSEAKSIALKAREIRSKINIASFNRVKYASTTVEGISSDKEFQFLISCMVYYNTEPNKKYFKDYNDYLNRAGDIDAYLISNKVAEALYGGNESGYVENKFLKTYGFIDDKMRLINKDGKFISSDGKLINEFGQYVKYDEDGKEIIVDENGQPLEIKIEQKPFLDEEGKPIEK